MSDVTISVTPLWFAKVFPFHIVFDEELRICQVGRSLGIICPEFSLGTKLTDHAEIFSPNVEMTFAALGANTHLLLVLQTKASNIPLRGQLVFAEQPGMLIFLCSPWLVEQPNLKSMGLKVNDFAIHDPVVDLLHVIQGTRTALSETRELAEEIKEKQKQLQRERDRAEAASEAKSQFLANMSHELRTPLNSVLGFSQMLSEGIYGKLTEPQERCIEHIRSSGSHLLQLIDDILDLAKVESGSLDVHMDAFSIADLLTNLEATAHSLLHEKGIGISLQSKDVESDRLIADVQKMRQIFYNLIGNAGKFTESGGLITVELSELVLNVIDRSYLEIRVRDNGQGVDPISCESIFHEFYQVDSSLSREKAGVGLGLALVRQLVALHQGCVWVESTGVPGEGTTVHVIVPIAGPELEPTNSGPSRSDRQRVIIRHMGEDCEPLVEALDAVGVDGVVVESGTPFLLRVLADPADMVIVLSEKGECVKRLGVVLGQACNAMVTRKIPLVVAAPEKFSENDADNLYHQASRVFEALPPDDLANAVVKMLSDDSSVG